MNFLSWRKRENIHVHFFFPFYAGYELFLLLTKGYLRLKFSFSPPFVSLTCFLHPLEKYSRFSGSIFEENRFVNIYRGIKIIYVARVYSRVTSSAKVRQHQSLKMFPVWTQICSPRPGTACRPSQPCSPWRCAAHRSLPLHNTNLSAWNLKDIVRWDPFTHIFLSKLRECSLNTRRACTAFTHTPTTTLNPLETIIDIRKKKNTIHEHIEVNQSWSRLNGTLVKT